MKEPSTALEWWREAEKELARAMKPYRQIGYFMKKKHLTRKEAKKAERFVEHAAESMFKAAGSLDELQRQIRVALGE